jgi:hypothetical protein
MGMFHVVLAPGPRFRDVFGIFKVVHQMMLVARRQVTEGYRAHEVKS